MSYLSLIFFISKVEIPTVPKIMRSQASMAGGTVTTIVLLACRVCHAWHLQLTNVMHSHFTSYTFPIKPREAAVSVGLF